MMGFKLEFSEGDNIIVQLPKEDMKKNWELTKKIVDMYFEEPKIMEGKK
jgi:hypothetical protein